ncbi:hypothetical protein [Arthrobacter sp. QXT-31]|uniref:hypothetical protein n=1 Tax=Arthrobacter sp. QXT-31 TaxID=1357915 RepID=UPI001F22FF92|nr:hypothetical protein [Arthrobacter sp. QXT-31]
MPAGAFLKITASRVIALLALAALVGLLPWLSGRGAEYTILRARYSDREPTPEALAAVRAELGLEEGPGTLLLAWIRGSSAETSAPPGSATLPWGRALPPPWAFRSR